MPIAVVINPNTSAAMTDEIGSTALRVFQPPWTCRVREAPAGPESLESWTDYHLASVCVLPLADSEPDQDGIVLACFGDPGLYLLKEQARVPVVGIAEASMSLAMLLGAQFGILAGMTRAVELMDSMVATYRLHSRYAGTVPLDMRVLSFQQDRDRTLDTLEKASLRLRAHGAEVLLLGCAGLTTFVDELQARVAMPVIDPVEAGCRMLQAVVDSGLDTSQIGLYARAAPQRMHRLGEIFSERAIRVIERDRKEGRSSDPSS